MKIYIDFDRTLFNTDFFLEDLEKINEKYHISKELFDKYYIIASKENGFNPYEVLKAIEKDMVIDKKIYFDIKELINSSWKYVYDDAIPFLEEVRKKHYNIILFTKGNYDFQLDKVKNAKLIDYFDAVITTLKTKGELDLDYEKSIFIDDNPKELESIKLRNPKRIIRIQRENTKFQSNSTSSSFEIVHSLQEIIL